MYLDHFGLAEPPFTITPHTEFFFAGANRGATLDALLYAITAGEGIVKVSGEVGSGKTMLCRVLMERLPAHVATVYLAIPSLSRDEMLTAIAGDLGLQTSSDSTSQLVRRLQDYLIGLHSEGKRVVALIDEAHAMPLDSLEEIRLLSNLETNRSKLLQLVLFGQPELDEHLALPQMRQLRERITHSFSLSPLTREDTGEYLRFRLAAAGYRGADVFDPACVARIHRASEGLTRRVNIIADKSLLAAFSQGTKAVTPKHVAQAIGDSDFARPIRRANRVPWLVGGALATGIVLGGAAVFLSQEGARTVPPPQAGASVAAPVAASPTVQPPAVAPLPATAPAAAKPLQSSDTPPKLARNLAYGNGVTPVPPTSIQTPPPTPAAAEAPPIDERLKASSDWIAQAPPSHFVVQLLYADASSQTLVDHFLRTADQSLGPGKVFAYRTTHKGRPKLGVLYGSFSGRSQAVSAIGQLPAPLKQYQPYVRTFNLIRNEAIMSPVTSNSG